MKVEWWYNDAAYHYAKGESLALARLSVRPDRTARVLTDADAGLRRGYELRAARSDPGLEPAEEPARLTPASGD